VLFAENNWNDQAKEDERSGACSNHRRKAKRKRKLDEMKT
jgi:hypothetical protein